MALNPRRRRSFLWRSQIGLGCSSAELTSRREAFEQYVQQNPYPQEEEQQQDDEPLTESLHDTNNHNDLDPLTAMLMQEQTLAQQQEEMDREYRKEMARRKRVGRQQQQQHRTFEEESFDTNVAALQIIDKDLLRLSHPSGKKNDNDDNDDAARKKILRQVLYLYNCRHNHVGYRQGMHEVASWLLWALECDYNNNTSDVHSLEGDPVLQSELAVECYFMTEAILSEIQPAFDVGEHKPMEHMSRRILTLIHKADTQVWERLTSLGVPPAIYLTKWIRLIFSREVLHVLSLWDALFQAKQDGFAWMMILEATAAARLLQHRVEIILSPEDGLLNLLMNLPPEQDIQPMMEYLQPLLRGEAIVVLPIRSPRATIPNDSYATSNATVQNPLFTSTAVETLASRLSGVKETLAAQTQSISKRLKEEWENMQLAEADQADLRSYDDGFWHQSLGGAVGNDSQRPFGQAPTTSSPQHVPPAVTKYPPHTWGYELEHRIGVLQNFVMLVEQQNKGSVNASVWEALADLEDIRQAISLQVKFPR